MKKTYIFIICSIVVLVFCGIGLHGNISGEKFDSNKWKTTKLDNEHDMSLRWDMMNSLRNNHKLVGMSKNEIIKLLGKPDSSFSTPKTFRYFLGYAHFGIDTGSLIIEFENETVENYLVTRG
ncbi:hypothetical protein KBJ98_15130 [Flavobacterium sp. F-328]|uniref:Lipoprotein SmpA/OmlA domain-containing protein n=1 Tax=Flavobacterium erciyesense TaxID=2825842 RepID=A0ABS5D7N7_9FLAO|nr:hypothetical protein [Flavobacterium erciyesense]MBQ0910044.1 hypothetical protein [Flavobacterium erciyesense]